MKKDYDLGASECPRYKISLKNGYKVLYIGAALLFFSCAFANGIAAIQSDSILFGFLMTFFFLVLGMHDLVLLSIKCEAYKGKIIYSSILKKKEYRLSDIVYSKEMYEEIHADYGDGNVTNSWDKITTFYNKEGKKLFKFGLAYNNVDLLVKEVMNTQKSILNQKRKK